MKTYAYQIAILVSIFAFFFYIITPFLPIVTAQELFLNKRKEAIKIYSVKDLAFSQKYIIRQDKAQYYTSEYIVNKNNCIIFANVVLCGNYSITKLTK